MNLSALAQILAAVNAGIGQDTPCQNEVLAASTCILGAAPLGGASVDEIGAAVDCLTCPAVNSPDPNSMTCADLFASTYCVDVGKCVESKCNADCSTETSVFFQCINGYFSTACGVDPCPTVLVDETEFIQLPIILAQEEPCKAEGDAVNQCVMSQVADSITEEELKSVLTSVANCASCQVPENSNEFCADVTSPDYCTGVNECKGLNCNICGDEFTSYFTCLDEIIATGCAGFSPCGAKNVAAVKSFLRHA